MELIAFLWIQCNKYDIIISQMYYFAVKICHIISYDHLHMQNDVSYE